jgi:hypothetical protein
MSELNEMLAFYAAPGVMTATGEQGDFLAGLPAEIPGLVRVVQGALIHVFWAERYGRQLSETEQATLQVRPADEKLERMRQADPRPLAVKRDLDQRQVGNCRDFSVLLTALLRRQGTPARARCGFGTYFLPVHFEDHWVVEYWHGEANRWVMVDAQLDELQQKALKIDFDPLDMPPGKFVIGGEAYRMCRAGEADADTFGIFDMHGLDFIRGDLVRDFLSLNKVEILPWDWGWGYLTEKAFANLALFDHLAALLTGGDAAFPAIRAEFESNPSLALPKAPISPGVEIQET